MNEKAIDQARRDAVAACRRAGATREQAEDAAQQALLEACRNERALDDDRPLSGWLQTTAYRRYLDHHRATHRESSVGLDSHYWHRSDPTAAPVEDALLNAANAKHGVAALAELPTQTQNVVRLVAGGHSVGQVAVTLNTTTASVSNCLYRARQHVRRSLVLPAVILIGTLASAVARAFRRAAPGVGAAAPALVLVLAIHDTARPTTALDDAIAVPLQRAIATPAANAPNNNAAPTPAAFSRAAATVAGSPFVARPASPRPQPAAKPAPTTVADGGLVIITSEPVDGPSTPAEVILYCLENIRVEPYIGC